MNKYYSTTVSIKKKHTDTLRRKHKLFLTLRSDRENVKTYECEKAEKQKKALSFKNAHTHTDTHTNRV